MNEVKKLVMSHDPIDLRTLPVWLQYVISLTVVAVVAAAAWVIGKDQPVPNWLTTKMIPALGWVYIGLFTTVMIGRWVGKKSD
jgi:heme A synthase